MTSDRIKYYVVRLLGSKHHLWGLKNAAFPHAINNEPHNPFQQLRTNSAIGKVIVEPEFCSTSTNTADCIPDDTHVTLILPPGVKVTFIVEGFQAEFHWIKLDGTD